MARSKYGRNKAQPMPNPTLALLALLVSAAATAAPMPAGNAPGQVQYRGQIIVRIPNAPMPAVAPLVGNLAGKPLRFKEKKGPKCVPIGQLGGALLNDGDLDLLLRGGDRLRAKLDGDCRAMGFYAGIYLKANADGQVCAGRDTIRTRTGDSCGIKRFHKLVAKR